MVMQIADNISFSDTKTNILPNSILKRKRYVPDNECYQSIKIIP